MYVDKAKPDKQISHAFGNGIPMILWIGEDELKNGQLNLKVCNKLSYRFCTSTNR